MAKDQICLFYAGLTDGSKSYLDSCAGCVFRQRTPDDAEEFMGKIAKNHEDWSVLEPRGMLVPLLESASLPSAIADGKGHFNRRQRLCRQFAVGKEAGHDFIGKQVLCRQPEIDRRQRLCRQLGGQG